MDAVHGIGFDLDHTLAIDNRLERVALLRVLERILANGGRSAGTFADEIDGIDELLVRQRHGGSTIDAAVDSFVTSHGVAPDRSYVETFRSASLAMVEEFVVALPGVEAMLQALDARGIPNAVLTNGWSELQHAKARRAGFSGAVLVSSEIGALKPSAAAFGCLLAELGTAPARTWYVGDSPDTDIAGASAAGLQTVWFGWERKTYPAGIPKPQHTIRALDELAALLPHAMSAS